MAEILQRGTGIFVPEGLWNKALPALKRTAPKVVGKDGKQKLGVRTVTLRLASGRVIGDVVVDWSREVLFRWTGLRGPETTKDGLDFRSDAIVGIRVALGSVLGLWGRAKWFSV